MGSVRSDVLVGAWTLPTSGICGPGRTAPRSSILAPSPQRRSRVHLRPGTRSVTLQLVVNPESAPGRHRPRTESAISAGTSIPCREPLPTSPRLPSLNAAQTWLGIVRARVQGIDHIRPLPNVRVKRCSIANEPHELRFGREPLQRSP